ncbi:MAG: hypothetical protein ABII79_12195 [bacterium]
MESISLKRAISWLLVLVPALLIYTYLARDLDFTQDDAYISYRYVQNYLNGDGLVYNIGERVEGFTNFGWVIYLILWGALGVNYILVSKITGFLFGAATIVLVYFLARLVFADRDRWVSFLPVYLVAASMSHAYWSPAGLETAAFGFLVIFSLYCYLRRNWWLILGLLLLVWIRPEGALVAGLLVLVETVVEKRFPRFCLSAGLIAFVLSLPYVVFKIWYYGSLLPNPFYAKTGFSLEQATSGLEYAGRFFRHYWLYGLSLVVPVFFFRRLPKMARSIWLFAVLYVVYIILVGGDVLKVHRFFLPLFGIFGVLFTLSIWLFLARRVLQTKVLILFLSAVVALALTYNIPRNFVLLFNHNEKVHTRKMSFLASQMKLADSTNFSVAMSTIGIFGYELMGHDVIDLLGLTDSTIARHPEPPIPGMQTTWKEHSFNSRYVLKRAPDYITFSTGAKPSAPAEQALLLYPQFLEGYRGIGWVYRRKDARSRPTMEIAFKKVRDFAGEPIATYPIEYVHLFAKGHAYQARMQYREAMDCFNRAMALSPQPYYPYLVYEKALLHMEMSQDEIGWRLLNELVQQDSLVYEAHQYLYLRSRMTSDENKAEVHKRWIQKLVPWYWPEVEAITERKLAAQRSR